MQVIIGVTRQRSSEEMQLICNESGSYLSCNEGKTRRLRQRRKARQPPEASREAKQDVQRANQREKKAVREGIAQQDEDYRIRSSIETIS